MFSLQDSHGKPVLMRNGEPFTYSSRATARAGQRFISKDRGEDITIVDAQHPKVRVSAAPRRA